MGIAWVSGDGGTRGYWTDGTHRDPLTGRDPRGDAAGPDPVRGRRLREARGRRRHDGGFEHNAERPVGATPRGDAPTATASYLLRDRGGLRRPRPGLQRAGPLHHRLARRAATTARRGGRRPSTSSGSRRSARGPVQAGGLAPDRRTVRRRAPTSARRTTSTSTASTVALRLVRRGHAVPGHLGPGEPEADRVLAARRHARLGLLHAQAATSTRPTTCAASTCSS